jgi:hypothetical protein
MPTEPDEGYLDDEFAKFRAARLKRGATPLEPHAAQATQTPPRTSRPPPPPLPTRESPHAATPPPGPRAATPPAQDEHPTGAGRRLEVVEEPPPGDDFERFRAQRLRESGRRETTELPLEPTTLPAPAADAATRPTVKLAEAPEDGLFFGTSTTERLSSRAHAREARADGDVTPPKGDEAA